MSQWTSRRERGQAARQAGPGLGPSEMEAPLAAARPLTIAHDYLTQRGGAERVNAALVEALLPDRFVTAVHEPEATFPIEFSEIETTFLQRVAAFRADPRRALPLLPLAWGSVAPVAAGVVICSSSGWAHAIPVRGDARKIVYCHNPARWLYQPEDYLGDQPRAVRIVLGMLRSMLVRWDRQAAATADLYIANSTDVAQRIRQVYGREAVVVHPPISVTADGRQAPMPDVEPGYFMTVGRGRGYKNTDALIDAFREMPDRRLVVVGVRDRESTPDNVTLLGRVTDEELRWLYANARALVSISHEDFGLTPLEANAFGTPALVLRAGGFLDSLDEGVSGLFVEDATASAVRRAVLDFPETWDRGAILAHAARFSVEEFVRQVGDVVRAVVDHGAGTTGKG